MKRTLTMSSEPSSSSSSSSPKKPKFIPQPSNPNNPTNNNINNFDKLDDNLLYEVFKHADAKTLAVAACVSKQWHHTALDERLWELIWTRHWNNSVNCATQQLRSVVLALGGFRRLHALYLSKTTSTSAPVLPRLLRAPAKRWGKDEVNLSLSLLSIRFYEKMNSANTTKRQ